MNHLPSLRSRATRASLGHSACPAVTLALLAGLAWPVSSTWANRDTSARLRVLEQAPERVVLEFSLGAFSTKSVETEGQPFVHLVVGHATRGRVPGAPDVPTFSQSIIIPDDAAMTVRVLETEWHDITDLDLVPARGPIPRHLDLDEVPYRCGPEYGIDADYPGAVVSLGQPYILRNFRGLAVRLSPFQYNPVQRQLRVYSRVTVEVSTIGPGETNVLTHRPAGESVAFQAIYRNHFANYVGDLRYPPLDESGNMLIICHDPWVPNVQPLATHKTGLGIDTTVVPVSAIGNNPTAIKSYIQNVYETSDLAFVLLVGDAEHVATPYESGGAADPTYAKLAGDDDYPDILVGRFSAATAAHVDTQVERTLTYETLPATEQDWFWRGAGIGSDTEILDSIRAALLAYGYTHVDQLYDPGTTPDMIIAALDDGRGIINYDGHASVTGWLPSGFVQAHVDMLTNADQLPFIFNVASNCGDFTWVECFAETWLRAEQGGAATGAIGAYMSSTTQYWLEPTVAQAEFIDLYLNGTYVCFGTLCFAASCAMIDEYGASGVAAFDTWILFGDPTLRVVGTWLLPGNYDQNGDVDFDDFAHFPECMTGPDGSLATEDCAAFCLDTDPDVDLGDFALLQEACTGPLP